MYDAKVIDKAIEKQKLTNEKVAVAAGLSSRTVSLIRNGEENVRLNSLRKTAEALNLKVEIRLTPKAA
jgi:transcriptional regulator with XRE-family HTH domain